MRIYGRCKNCRADVSCSTSASTRIEFIKKHNEYKEIECQNCGTITKFHIDDLRARESKLAKIVAFLILVIGTPLTFVIFGLFYTNFNVYAIVGGFFLIPVIIYRFIQNQDQQRVLDFNRNNTRGRR